MSVTVDQFGKAIVAAGLMPADELKAMWSALPKAARPKDSKTFAKLLVQQEKLTNFQAEELLSGRGTPLVLGDYVLLARIGAGGMGQVFKAQHRVMDRLVAIKLLPAELVRDDAAIKRFQREVKAAAKLTHPNIVAALDASVQRGVHYLVMECVDGQDLSAIVNERGPLPVDEAVDYILQAARGLAFAHAKGVVHRDIKPANLLRDQDGVVKILDMGLARIEDGKVVDQQLTNTGMMMGTVDYMAPEQVTDTRRADARSDVYSLGCSLYRLLTGDSVFAGDALIKLMAHMNQPAPSLLDKRPDVPVALDRIFQKMLAKKPEERHQQAAQVAADLEALYSPSGERSSQQDTNRNHVIRSVGSKHASPTAVTLPPVAATVMKHVAVSALDQTTAISNAEIQSDADNAITMPFVASAPPSPAMSKRKGNGVAKKLPTKLIAAGAACVLLLLLLGVWAIFRDKDGKEIARMNTQPPASVTNTPVAQPPDKSPTPTPVRSALQFDGPASYAEYPDLKLEVGQAYTLETWLLNADNEFRITARRPDDVMEFWRSNGQVKWVTVKERKLNGLGGPPGPAGSWSHYAGVVDAAGKLTLFVDGKPVADAIRPFGQPNVDAWPNFIGFYSLAGNRKPDQGGTVASVRISKGARYVKEFVPAAELTKDADTLALYLCDEGQGYVLTDSSGNNHHGKIVKAKWVAMMQPLAK